MPKICSHTGCNTPVFSKGFCQYHWKQWKAGQQSLAQTDSSPAKPIKVGDVFKETEPQWHDGEFYRATYKVVSVKPTNHKPIKPISDKQTKRLAKYRVARDEHFKEFPTCQYPGCSSTDITCHHAAGKVGSLLWNKKYFRSLCWPHHLHCELHPDEAKELGLSLNRLDK